MAVNWDVQGTIDDVRSAALRGVADGVELVKATAIEKIQSGSKTGIVYRRRGIEHVASAPGEPPASDSGRLVQSSRTELDEANTSGQVIFATAYAAALEFGREDGSIASRPYARSSLAEKREEIEKGISDEIIGALR